MSCPNGHDNPPGQAFCGTCGAPLRHAEDDAAPIFEPGHSRPPLLVAAYVTLGIALVSSFLPWVRVLFITVNGTEGDGILTAIAAIASGGFLISAVNRAEVKRGFVLTATVFAVAGAAVYLYNAIRLNARYLEENDEPSLFEINVTPQAGLYLGTMASIAAVYVLTVIYVGVRRHGNVETPTSGTLLVAGGAATLAALLALIPDWTALTGIAAVVAIVLGAKARGASNETDARMVTIVIVIAALAFAGAIAVSVLDDSNGSDVASCDEVFADGATTQQSWKDDGVLCDRGDERQLVFTMEQFCIEDDKAIPLVNDYGWGVVGDDWHAGAEPPDC